MCHNAMLCVVRKWFKVEAISTVSEPVRDLAFSPNLGRSYHMLAVASKDVHIFSLKPLTRFSTFCVSIIKTIGRTGWYKLNKASATRP